MQQSFGLAGLYLLAGAPLCVAGAPSDGPSRPVPVQAASTAEDAACETAAIARFGRSFKESGAGAARIETRVENVMVSPAAKIAQLYGGHSFHTVALFTAAFEGGKPIAPRSHFEAQCIVGDDGQVIGFADIKADF